MFTDKIIQIAFFISFLLFVLTCATYAFSYHLLPPLIPIFNQMPWGQNRIGTKQELLIPLAITAAVIVGNLLLTSRLYQKLPLVSRMIAISSSFIGSLLLLFFLRTILVVLY